MGYTNETTHYGIPLPLGSDLTTPMDYNTAAEAVDTAVFQATTDAAGAVSTAGTAQTAAAEAQTSAANAVADAATAHGLADTAVQAASAAQTAAENAQTTATAAAATASAVSAVIGTGTLDTEAQTVIPAINEVNTHLTMNNLDDSVQITTPYTDINHLYTFPSDGYVQINATGSLNGVVNIYGASDTNNEVKFSMSNGNVSSLFVRKGMRCYIDGTADIYFKPLM